MTIITKLLGQLLMIPFYGVKAIFFFICCVIFMLPFQFYFAKNLINGKSIYESFKYAVRESIEAMFV